MVFFVNGRFLTQHPTGVQFFAQEICNELQATKPINFLTQKTTLNNHYQLANKNIKQIGIFKGHLWEQISLPWFLFWQKKGFLLNFCNTAPLFIKNQLVTVHDLAFMRKEKWFNPVFKMAYQFLIPSILKKSKVVPTVSETIKKEMEAYFKLPSTKISVISNKISAALISATATPPNFPVVKNDFYLMVGSDNPRKNFAWVEKQFTAHFPTKTLVIVGSNHQSFLVTEKINSNHILRISTASANELAWLYQNAIAFINPSFYEGFGIPNIEAMYFNCPILCANIPVFREVCEEVAVYFELNNSTDFIEKLNAMEKIDKPQFALLAKKRVAFYQNKNNVETFLKLVEK
ncbi:MAG: glycosyltransferase family 4 protein [Vicingaceae bacterium]|nr:glycosyltransferase family 4 protein [Vicingaceae bacterium]